MVEAFGRDGSNPGPFAKQYIVGTDIESQGELDKTFGPDVFHSAFHTEKLVYW